MHKPAVLERLRLSRRHSWEQQEQARCSHSRNHSACRLHPPVEAEPFPVAVPPRMQAPKPALLLEQKPVQVQKTVELPLHR